MYRHRAVLNLQLLFFSCSYVIKSIILYAVNSEDYRLELLSSDYFSVLLINDQSYNDAVPVATRRDLERHNGILSQKGANFLQQ